MRDQCLGSILHTHISKTILVHSVAKYVVDIFFLCINVNNFNCKCQRAMHHVLVSWNMKKQFICGVVKTFQYVTTAECYGERTHSQIEKWTAASAAVLTFDQNFHIYTTSLLPFCFFLLDHRGRHTQSPGNIYMERQRQEK